MTNSWHASFPPCRMSKTKVVPYLSKSGSTFAFFFWLILLVAPPPFFIGIWKARTRTKSPLLCKTVNHIRFQSSWSLFYKEESPYCHNIDLSWSSAYHAVLLVNSFWPKFFRIVHVTLCQHQDINIELHYSRSNVSWSIPREREFPTAWAFAVTIAAPSTTPKLAHFAFYHFCLFPHFGCSLLTSAWTFGDWCRLVLKSTSRSPPPRQNYPPSNKPVLPHWTQVFKLLVPTMFNLQGWQIFIGSIQTFSLASHIKEIKGQSHIQVEIDP